METETTRSSYDFININNKKDQKRHYIMTQVSIQPEDVTILNIYTPDAISSKFIKKHTKPKKRERNTIKVRTEISH